MNAYEQRQLIAKAERFKRRPCAHCGAGVENIEMYRTVKRSGDSQYYWFCMACNRRAAAGAGENIGYELLDFWIAHNKFPGITKREEFTLLHVYEGQPCVVRGCGDTETQEHNWAPKGMAPSFGPDWVNWPTAYLCKYHHEQWHAIITPDLVRYNGKVADFEAIFREAAGI